MGAGAFVVTLREAFEAALVLGILYTWLDRIRAREGFRLVTAGALAGLLASVALGVALSWLSGPLLDLGPDVLAVAVMLLAVVLLTWHGWWMRRHAAGMTGEIHDRLARAHADRRLWMVALIAFTAVFREGAETVLFLWGLMAQASEGAGWTGLGGAVGGVGAAAVLGWLVFRGGRRLGLGAFFTVTTALILVLAAGLCATAAGRLQALGVLPASEPLWDTSAWLSDGGLVGGLLSGLTGYRPQPTAHEVAAYVLYLVVAGALVLSARRGGTRAAASASLGEPGS